MQSKREIQLMNISGPYAVGKDTLLNAILDSYPEQTYRVRTITTRSVDKNTDPSYTCLSLEEFRTVTSNGRWLTNYQISGSVAYGTSIDEIEEKAKTGLVCIHSIYAGPNGAGKLREFFGKKVFSIGMLGTDGDKQQQIQILRDRLHNRGRDDAENLEARIMHQGEAIEYVLNNNVVVSIDGPMRVFDEIIINKYLEETIQTGIQTFQKIIEGYCE